MNVIKPIYADLNDDSVIVGHFIEVLAKKTTENAIYEKFKEEYEGKFGDLKTLSDQIKQQKEVINNVVQKNSDKIRNKPQPNINNEAMNYFRMLDQYANMYLSKYEKLMKGDKYYNGLYEKITNLVKLGNEWMIKRSDEKNAILSTISGPSAYRQGGNNNNNYLTQSALMDPNRNPFTKMNVPNINQRNPMGNNNQGGNFNNNQGGYGHNQGNFGGNQGNFGGNRGY